MKTVFVFLLFFLGIGMLGCTNTESSDKFIFAEQMFPVQNAVCPIKYAKIDTKALMTNSKGELFATTKEGFIKKFLYDFSNVTVIAGSGANGDFDPVDINDLNSAYMYSMGKLIFDPNDESIMYVFLSTSIARLDLVQNTFRVYPGVGSVIGSGVFGSDGLLYYISYYCVKTLNVTSGEFVKIAGSCSSSGNGVSGNSYSTEKLGGMSGIAFFNEDIYVADKSYGCIRKLSTSDGKLYTFAGVCGTKNDKDGTGTGAKFGSIDHAQFYQDSFYIGADSKVRKANLTTGVVTTLFTTEDVVVDLTINKAKETEFFYLLDDDPTIFRYDGSFTTTLVSRIYVDSYDSFPVDCLTCERMYAMDVLRNGDLIFNCNPANALLKLSLKDRMVTPLLLAKDGFANPTFLKANPYNESHIYYSDFSGIHKLVVGDRTKTDLGSFQSLILTSDGISLTGKQFKTETSVVINPYTNDIYFIEFKSSMITKVNGDKIVPFVTGVTNPKSLAFAPDGRIFLYMAGTSTINLVSDGSLSNFYSGLGSIHKILYYQDAVYVLSTNNGAIFKVSNNTSVKVTATYLANNDASPCSGAPKDFLINGTYIYVLCSSTMKRIPIDGGVMEDIHNSLPTASSFILVNDMFVITSPDNSYVIRFKIGESYSAYIGEQQLANGPIEGIISSIRLNYPSSISCDNNGTAYLVFGQEDYLVRVIKVANGVSTLYSGQGDGLKLENTYIGTIATFDFAPNGELLIANTAIKKINKNGKVSNVIGYYGVESQLPLTTDVSAPYMIPIPAVYGMVRDSSNGALYFTTGKYQIQKLFNNTYSPVAGTGSSGFSGDDSLAINAKMSNYGASLTFDSSRQEIIFPDKSNNVVRMVNINSGNISTILGSGTAGVKFVANKPNPLSIRLYKPAFIGGNGDDIYIAEGGTSGTPRIIRIRGCDEVGWTGVNCNIPMCFGLANYSSAVCSGHGSCSGPDTCLCNSGYEGLECDQVECFGISYGNSNVCSGHGDCIDYNKCSCNPGYFGINCSQFDCGGVLNNDINTCSGKGMCVGSNVCECSQYYYGTNCEHINSSAITCGGISFADNSTCSGYGNCVAPDTCVCKNVSQLIHYGSNCELLECTQSYYNIESNCTIYCRGDLNCSSNGYCDQLGSCLCNSNETIGFYTGSSCSRCQSNYYGNSCLTKFLDTMTFLSDDGLEINMNLFSPHSFNSNVVNCSNLIHSQQLAILGNNISCFWNDRLKGNFTIKLGASKSVSIGSVIKVNINLFNSVQSPPQYVETSIKEPQNPKIPVSIISNIETFFEICAEIVIDGSTSYNFDSNKLLFEWSLIQTPYAFNATISTNSSIRLLSNSPPGQYSVQLIVKSEYLNWKSLPRVFNFTKSSVLVPKIGLSTTTNLIGTKNLPFLVKKYEIWDNICGANTPDKLLLSYQWTQLEGGFVNYTQLSTNDIIINSFADFSFQKYVFQVSTLYMGLNNSAIFTFYKSEETFGLIIYQSFIDSNSVKINIQISPSTSVKYVNSLPWKWSCLLSEGKSCEQVVIDQLPLSSIGSNTKFKVSNVASSSFNLMLSINNQTSSLSVTFPRQVIVPVVDVISVYPETLYHNPQDLVTASFLVTVNGQSDGINDLIERNWTLNGSPINTNTLLGSNNIDLDLSTLQGATHTLMLSITSKSSKITSSKSIIINIATPPPKCICTVSPSTGFALDSVFTISCSNCVNTDQSLQLGFIDYNANVKVPLVTGSTSSLSIPLPYTGSSTQTLYSTVTNVNTLATTTTKFQVTIKLPIAPTIVEVKKKQAAWVKIFASLAVGNPKKIVYEYITTDVTYMLSALSSRKRTTSSCPPGYTKTDCSMTVVNWTDLTNDKYNTTKLIFDSYQRDPAISIDEQILTLQTLAIYRAVRTVDEVNLDMFQICWNLYKNQLQESLSNQNLIVSQELMSLLSNTIVLMTKSKEFIDVSLSQSFKDEIVNVVNGLLDLNAKNVRVGSSYQIDLGSFSSTITKLYPSDLSGRMFSVLSSVEGVQYPSMATQYIQNVDFRKVVYQKITKKHLNPDEIYSFKNISSTVNTSISGIPYVLYSEIRNQLLVIPKNTNLLSYSFHYVKSNVSSTSTLSATSDIICLSDSLCNIQDLGNDLYKCVCSSSNVTIAEKRTFAIIENPIIINNSTNNTNTFNGSVVPEILSSTSNETNPLPSNTTANNETFPTASTPITGLSNTYIQPTVSKLIPSSDLGYLGFLAIIVPLFVIILVPVVVVVCKKRHGKYSSNNVEMKIV